MAKVYEEYAWVILFALGLLWVVVGFTQTFFPYGLLEEEAQHVTDMSWNELKTLSPQATELVSLIYGWLGLLKISWSLLVIAITLTGYRKGEKWAWYTLCLVPILLVSNALFNTWFFGDTSEIIQWIPIMTITLLGLLLPYRKFFPR